MSDTGEIELGDDPSWQVQRAIYTRLAGVFHTEGADHVDVVDNVEAAEYEDSLPFILIGDDIVLDEESQVGNQYKVRHFIRCHAAGPSRKAAKQLAHRVRAAMKAQFTVEGFMNDDQIAYHQGTQNALIEGMAHVAIVEWAFDLLEDIG